MAAARCCCCCCCIRSACAAVTSLWTRWWCRAGGTAAAVPMAAARGVDSSPSVPPRAPAPTKREPHSGGLQRCWHSIIRRWRLRTTTTTRTLLHVKAQRVARLVARLLVGNLHPLSLFALQKARPLRGAHVLDNGLGEAHLGLLGGGGGVAGGLGGNGGSVNGVARVFGVRLVLAAEHVRGGGLGSCRGCGLLCWVLLRLNRAGCCSRKRLAVAVKVAAAAVGTPTPREWEAAGAAADSERYQRRWEDPW